MRAKDSRRNNYVLAITSQACAKGPVHFVSRQFVIEPTASAVPETL